MYVAALPMYCKFARCGGNFPGLINIFSDDILRLGEERELTNPQCQTPLICAADAASSQRAEVEVASMRHPPGARMLQLQSTINDRPYAKRAVIT